MPKISVIIPVFKCEAYLRKCLNSVLAQTFQDFEIICVDDKTPDGSVAIIQEYQRREPRIRLLHHEENLGLGGARNTGIKAAQANYIASVDSDDTMKPHMLETLWSATEDGFYDIVSAGFDRVDAEGKIISTQTSSPKKLVDNIDIFKSVPPAFWNKLWRRSLFTGNNIWFPNHLYYQDSATTPRILAKARSVNVIKDVVYNYLVRPESVTQSTSAKHILDYFKVYDVIYDFLIENRMFDENKDGFLTYIDRGLNHHAQHGLSSLSSENEVTRDLRNLILFKSGYIAGRKLLDGKNKQELSSLLERTRTTADLLPPDGRPVLPLSVIVKTFLRPLILERFLLSVGEYEEANGVRFAEVVVGDDSPQADVEANVRAVKKAQECFPHLNIQYHTFDEYIGLSAGRNRLVKLARQPHVLLCDDDFIFDETSDISSALRIAQEGKFQLVGGWLKNKYDIASGSYVYWGTFGKFSETDDELIINVNEKPIGKDDFFPSDYLLNFYVADRECLIANPWDEELKVEEHQEFFYRFKQNGYRAGLFGGLFVKHTADRKDNPPRYNHFRFSKDVWEGYVFLALEKMNKKRRRFNRVRHDHYEYWTVEATGKKIASGTVPWKESVLGQMVPVTTLSPSTEQTLGGYYDVRLVSEDGRYAVCQTVPATDRLPAPTDTADILLIDLADGCKSRKVGSTSAWCHQQGAHAQFMYGDGTKLIYNIFDPSQNSFSSRSIDVDSGKAQTYSRPVSALSPDGRKVASLNFSRLYDYRPGYGYVHIPDPFADENAPAEDGLWTLDLVSGEETLLISYREAKAFLQQEGFHDAAAGKLIFNHVAFNTDGTKMLLLLRIFSSQAPHPTFTLVCNADGTNLRRIFGFASHYHWKDEDTILFTGSKYIRREDIKNTPLFELNTETGSYRQFTEDFFQWDGHCSYSPDRQYILFDSYPNAIFPYRRLLLYRIKDAKSVDLGHFHSPAKWFNNNADLRCDLHPRWSPDGRQITFDSIHEGHRGVYAIKTEDAVAALDSRLAYFPRSEWMRWYGAKYKAVPSPAVKPVSQSPQAKPDPVKNEVNARIRETTRYKVYGAVIWPFLDTKLRDKFESNPYRFFLDAKHPAFRLGRFLHRSLLTPT